MSFHQLGKLPEQKSSPPVSSSWPSVTAAVLLPSVGEQQKRSNNKPFNKSHPRRAGMRSTMLAAFPHRAREGVPWCKDPSEKLGQKPPWGQ